MIVAIVTALAVLALANVAVSVGVLRSSAYESGQKALQLILIWLLPVFGAVVVWAVLRGVSGERAVPRFDDAPTSSLGPQQMNQNSDAADLGGFGTHGGSN